MLTTVDYGEAAGIANIEWDAVELPSQFMENWCTDINTLKSFALHYQTGEVIPAEFIAKLKASKNFQSGLQMLRQLYFGALDMALHTSVPPSKSTDGSSWIYDTQAAVAQRFTVIPPLPVDRFLCGFSHIFGGGYAAGYYSYKWAEVMSADAFAAFEEVGLDNEVEVKRLGRLFRYTVLSCGGGRHPSDVYRNFRGRDPTVDALLRHSGLTTEDK
jgi:oligopeptidase A